MTTQSREVNHAEANCLSDALRQDLEIFRPCFRKRQWKYFVIVPLGLVECEERKTLSEFVRDVAVFEQVAVVHGSRGEHLDEAVPRTKGA